MIKNVPLITKYIKIRHNHDKILGHL